MMTAVTERSDQTLSPEAIIESFMTAYSRVYRKYPNVQYTGHQWYKINGEVVHRSDLLSETVRLNSLARQQRAQLTDRGVVSRLIAKLRRM